MHTLKEFFHKNIGQTISQTKILSEPLLEPFGGSVRQVFSKRYHATVLTQEKENVVVNVVGQRLSRSGVLLNDLDDEYGDVEISLKRLKGLDDFWDCVLKSADPAVYEALEKAK